MHAFLCGQQVTCRLVCGVHCDSVAIARGRLCRLPCDMLVYPCILVWVGSGRTCTCALWALPARVHLECLDALHNMCCLHCLLVSPLVVFCRCRTHTLVTLMFELVSIAG